MLKKTITYTDFFGTERTEDFYFNLSKNEIAKLELTTKGGMQHFINKIVAAQDTEEIFNIFQRIILMSYGEPTPDGKRFEKSEALTTAFTQTNAYDNLFMELGTNAEAASAFINGIMPKELVEQTSDANSTVVNMPVK